MAQRQSQGIHPGSQPLIALAYPYSRASPSRPGAACRRAAPRSPGTRGTAGHGPGRAERTVGRTLALPSGLGHGYQVCFREVVAARAEAVLNAIHLPDKRRNLQPHPLPAVVIPRPL